MSFIPVLVHSPIDTHSNTSKTTSRNGTLLLTSEGRLLLVDCCYPQLSLSVFASVSTEGSTGMNDLTNESAGTRHVTHAAVSQRINRNTSCDPRHAAHANFRHWMTQLGKNMDSSCFFFRRNPRGP